MHFSSQGLGLQGEEEGGEERKESGDGARASDRQTGATPGAAPGADARRKKEDEGPVRRAPSPTVEDELSALRKKLGL